MTNFENFNGVNEPYGLENLTELNQSHLQISIIYNPLKSHSFSHETVAKKFKFFRHNFVNFYAYFPNYPWDI